MRNVFVKKIIEEARVNKNLYLLTGDLGYNCFENFIKEFPERFINVGVAENNMVGIGSGLALSGKDVYLYSIIPFLIFRSLEQIRNNICHNNLNVKLIGAGGGFSYGNQGISHNPTEDLAIMRSLPNMKILVPGSKIETELAIDEMFKNKGPFFIRLGKLPSIEIHQKKPKYTLGKGLIIKEGTDIAIVCTGNISENVFAVSKNLEKKGLSVNMINYISIKPIDKKDFINLINKNTKIVSIEEHSEIGGLGSALSEILIESNLSKKIFKKIALRDKCHTEIGDQNFLREINDLGIEKMTNDILDFYYE